MARVPHHEHITVDEETYWSLIYLHSYVQRQLQSGALDDGVLRTLSEDAEERLTRSRLWNATDPRHADRPEPVTSRGCWARLHKWVTRHA